MEILPKYLKPTKSNFARLIGIAGLALTGTHFYNPVHRSQFAEFTTGVSAAFSRPEPVSLKNESKNISETALRQAYNKYFSGKEHLISYNAWVSNKRNTEVGEFEGIGRNLANLAQLYYESEKGKGESFDSYYSRFVDGLYKASQVAKVDFIVMVSALQVSGENTETLQEQKTDITVSRIQEVVIPAGRVFGFEYSPMEALRPYGLYPTLQESRIKGLLPTDPKEGRNINALTRFRSEVTIGMMDWEPSMRAKALLLFGSDEIKDIFKTKYPDLVKRYQNILSELGVKFTPIIDVDRDPLEDPTLLSARAEMAAHSNHYLSRFSGSLDAFSDNDTALAEIGIVVPLDEWQKYNHTDVWYYMVRNFYMQDENRSDEIKAVEETKKTLKGDFRDNRSEFYERLMSQQVLNPKFIEYLTKHATQRGNKTEIEALSRLNQAVLEYQIKASEVRRAYLEAAVLEGPLEYNSEFQQYATAMITKMLSEQSGPFDPNQKDSLYWHIYRLVAIRELSSPFAVVRETHFARDVSVDSGYAPEATLRHLEEFQNLLIEKGVISEPFWQDISPLIKIVSFIKSGNLSKYPMLSESDRIQIEQYFSYHVLGSPFDATNRSQMVLYNLSNLKNGDLGY